ncbi:60S ribosomal protein L24, putative [Perkinsus marinus ATCC 50983]|uniref:60S ribosomal protein L24, putative n=1 Tax=Perkinsus marinus (strain ATCC 50983 / TXsc) TaxID=423536 RepID=C5KU66_PERM5|nr:60S ribosomal protein L24, putative [Perkinsus marinus ATCC 50983]EER12108.1 60S ribosomal protein L24, putative [Perkinsus marinus ATCC 50983]|eukprot:XP_002780313.1 60S ribosomal protein L24, putative [Perkinsus marinus ATCC 50983]
MVVKTELCSYTEFRVYPGHGQRFIAKDGKAHFFFNSKAASLFQQRIKPVKLTWTEKWRRLNKKVRTTEVARKKTRRTVKVQKAIMGLSLEDFQKKKSERTQLRKEADAKRAAELKEKEKAKAARAAASKTAKHQEKPVAAKMPKQKQSRTGKRF